MLCCSSAILTRFDTETLAAYLAALMPNVAPLAKAESCVRDFLRVRRTMDIV